MVWALLIIPIGVGLLLGYTISTAAIGQKAAWRNLLTSTSFVLLIFPLIFALFFLPQPWREQVSIGVFTVFSVIIWISILTWPRRKRRAGSLLWNLGRPSTHRVILIAASLFFVIAILQTVVSIELARKGVSKSYGSPEYHLSQIIFYWSLAIYSFWAGLSRLELRENGIYFKFGLIKWAQIASYQWEGTKDNTLTVWLKQRFPFFPTRSWRIPIVHKPSIERIIAQYLSGGTKTTKKFY